MQHIPTALSLEEAITVLFCLVDDACERLNPHGGGVTERSVSYRTRECSSAALFQQLRGVESKQSFLALS